MPPEPDWLVDAPTAAAYVAHLRGRHCAPGTIWSWATRGHITRPTRGRYDIREIDTHVRRLIVTELIEWLRAQYDEDERVARKATHGGTPWRVDGANIVGRSWQASESSTETLVVRHTWPQEAEHIVRWDPNRALDEIDAKRRILDEVITPALTDDPTDETARHLLRLSALPYANRPGYLDTWRPDPTS